MWHGGGARTRGAVLAVALSRLGLGALVALMLVGCGGQGAASQCDEAAASAETALARAQEAHEAMEGVTVGSVERQNPSSFPSPTDTEGFYLSQESQANIANSLAQSRAQDAADAERRGHAEEGRRHLEHYTIVVEQNPDCFDADTRARAEQLARQISGETE